MLKGVVQAAAGVNQEVKPFEYRVLNDIEQNACSQIITNNNRLQLLLNVAQISKNTNEINTLVFITKMNKTTCS